MLVREERWLNHDKEKILWKSENDARTTRLFRVLLISTGFVRDACAIEHWLLVICIRC